MARIRVAAAAACIIGAMGVGRASAQDGKSGGWTPGRPLGQVRTVAAAEQPREGRTGGGWIRQEADERPRRGAGAITPEQRRTLANHHADVTAPVDAAAAGNAAPAWRFATQANVSHAPLIDGDRVYFAAWDCNIYCVDRRTGREVWRKRLGEPNQQWPWHGFAGTGAIGDGVLYEASVEGRAYAIDARTGDLLWEKDVAEDDQAGHAGALLYHGGLVYVGLSSAEDFLSAKDRNLTPDFRGRVMALDGRTGDVVWEADLVNEPSNGVGVKGGFALDPDLGENGTLYFATGSNYAGRPSALSDALVAVDARTGELAWYRQTTAGDVWTARNPEGPGFGFTAPPQLFNASINGERRMLVGVGQKSGVFHVFDRETGEPVWQAHVGYGNIGGGITAAASIGRDRVLAWGNNSFAFSEPERRAMTVAALDVETGRYRWVRSNAQPAGYLAAGFLAGDVYFVPSLDGRVRAFSAEDGRDLWESPEHAAIASSLVVDQDLLLFGTGVPGEFGGADQAEKGVYAYRLGGGGQGGAVVRPTSVRERDLGRQRINLDPAEARGRAGQDEGAERVVTMQMQGMRFEPALIRARPGERIRVHIANRSDMRHGLAFVLPGGERSLDGNLAEDEESELVITAPREPGEYWFYCPIHREQMKGRLIVEEGGGVQGPSGTGSPR